MVAKTMYNYRRKELNKRPPDHSDATFYADGISVSGPFLRAKASESSWERRRGNLRILGSVRKPLLKAGAIGE
jgi:hypothetical protein